MDPNKETIKTWNNLALAYEDKFMNLALYNESYDYLFDQLPKSEAKVLEIGCGPGNISKYLLTKKSDLDLLGIDTSEKMIELARKNNPSAQFQVMDARDIHQIKQKFDLIVSGFCIPYLSDIECKQLIDDAAGKLEPNGLFYMSFVEGSPEQSAFKTSTGGRVYFQYHQLNTLLAYLANADLQHQKTFKVDYRRSDTDFEEHSIIVAVKSDGLKPL